MKTIRRATEPEVIAEFLRNEFYREEFHRDRKNFEHLVLQADTTNETANALRRALLFRRRGHMWRELPADTQWWEVEVEPNDLHLLRVFPRAQWRHVSAGSFLLRDIAERISNARFHGNTREFISKVQALSYHLRNNDDRSCVLLIGIDLNHPVTILEGNHRLAAALLAGSDVFRSRFRVLCGFSPNMNKSCWYETNFSNLWRYARNRLRHLFYDKDADIARVLNEALGRALPVEAQVQEQQVASSKRVA
jgi:hypothetical protein